MIFVRVGLSKTTPDSTSWLLKTQSNPRCFGSEWSCCVDSSQLQIIPPFWAVKLPTPRRAAHAAGRQGSTVTWEGWSSVTAGDSSLRSLVERTPTHTLKPSQQPLCMLLDWFNKNTMAFMQFALRCVHSVRRFLFSPLILVVLCVSLVYCGFMKGMSWKWDFQSLSWCCFFVVVNFGLNHESANGNGHLQVSNFNTGVCVCVFAPWGKFQYRNVWVRRHVVAGRHFCNTPYYSKNIFTFFFVTVKTKTKQTSSSFYLFKVSFITS